MNYLGKILKTERSVGVEITPGGSQDDIQELFEEKSIQVHSNWMCTVDLIFNDSKYLI